MKRLKDVSRNHLKLCKVYICVSTEFCILNHPSLCHSLCPSCGLGGGGDFSKYPPFVNENNPTPAQARQDSITVLWASAASKQSLAAPQLKPEAQAKSDTQLRVRTAFTVAFPSVSLPCQIFCDSEF